MLNIGTGEIIVIAVVALLILGPKRLPELARGIGKFMREFRRQTDDVRNVVEREFYKMDQELDAEPPPVIAPSDGAVPSGGDLPPHSGESSQLTAGMPSGEGGELQQTAMPLNEGVPAPTLHPGEQSSGPGEVPAPLDPKEKVG